MSGALSLSMCFYEYLLCVLLAIVTTRTYSLRAPLKERTPSEFLFAHSLRSPHGTLPILSFVYASAQPLLCFISASSLSRFYLVSAFALIRLRLCSIAIAHSTIVFNLIQCTRTSYSVPRRYTRTVVVY